jgi:hypothetical protein
MTILFWPLDMPPATSSFSISSILRNLLGMSFRPRLLPSDQEDTKAISKALASLTLASLVSDIRPLPLQTIGDSLSIIVLASCYLLMHLTYLESLESIQKMNWPIFQPHENRPVTLLIRHNPAKKGRVMPLPAPVNQNTRSLLCCPSLWAPLMQQIRSISSRC